MRNVETTKWQVYIEKFVISKLCFRYGTNLKEVKAYVSAWIDIYGMDMKQFFSSLS